MMASRWAYEAMAVDQFINGFEKPFYQYEKKKPALTLKPLSCWWNAPENAFILENYKTKNDSSRKSLTTTWL